MGRACLLLSLVLLLTSCGTLMTGAGDAAQTARMRMQPDRMVVIAVDNPAATNGAQAGSTPHGYDQPSNYSVSDRAQASLDAVARRFGLEEVGAWTIVSLKLQCVVYRLPAEAVRDDVLVALRKDRRIRLAEPLQTFDTLGTGPAAAAGGVTEPSAYNDPYWQLQKGFAQVDARGAQQWSQGEGVRVAIVDTGADLSHEDLHGRVAMASNFVDASDANFSSDRHGTEVAGIIAAVANNHQGIVGIAPQAQLAVFKACWQVAPAADAAQCNSFTLAEALGAAIESGSRIINLSLGGPADPLLAELVQAAIGRGIVVVGAVPPNGRTDGFPTGIPGVLAVDRSDHLDANPRILHAPGGDIVTLTPGGHYDFVSGSSFATAHVSGTVALLLALSPHLASDAIVSLLQTTSDPADSVSSGRTASINACAALSHLQGKAACGSPMAALPPASGRAPLAGENGAQHP